MKTEDLIRTLADDVPVVPRSALGRRLTFGMLAGAAVSLVLVATLLGIRPDLAARYAASRSG
jgi:hypothetical protein